MKKFLILSITSILILTGCGAGATETLNCTNETTNGNITTRISYAIDHEDTEVKKVRVTYDYNQMDNNNNNTNNQSNNNTGGTDNSTNNQSNNTNNTTGQMDGVGTGTDGTTNDTQIDDDGIIDGVVGSAIDTIIGATTDVILDIAGLRDRHNTVQNTYGNINGFSVQNTTDEDSHYRVTYVIDFDKISDDDLATLNLDRNSDTLRNNYTSQGFTCK